MMTQLPVQLIASILAAFFLGKIFDINIVSFFYSLSSCFIEGIIFILPFMIFSFIFQALINSQKGSLKLILFIFLGVTISNCLALLTAFFYGKAFLPFLTLSYSPEFLESLSSPITLLFSLHLPKLMSTEKALALGLFGGICLNLLNDSHPIKIRCKAFGERLNAVINVFLQKFFMPLLPLYVFGFCLKLSYDNALIHLFQQFGQVFILSLSLIGFYLFGLYFIGSGGNIKKTFSNIRQMIPAGLMGFSTMSSAVSMPVTLKCAEKTTGDSNFSRLIIPSTANIHMLGDDLNLVIVSLTLLSLFGMPWPDFLQFIPFIMAFSFAKLSCVGVPGASVLVILPVLQTYLGFTSEMISILTTLYVLQDSFGTAANVMGNGAFATIIHRCYAWIKPVENVKAESL